MKVIVDTNVLVSGVFFGGIPGLIIDAWGKGKIEILITEVILEEYSETVERMVDSGAFEDYLKFLRLLVGRSSLVQPATLSKQVCSDSDDDKFLACALGGGAKIIISGDKALLGCSGYRGITVLTPREFVDHILNS